ncbi:GAF domain nucleotide-binding protein [Trichoderma harzianum]|uniref:GAF domain nucleotide-binding protein n=1 Tax=Trichoderma harzianum TaxID=5544 RepID=A0A0F9ZYH9_TRIHA|nr:GAF domain nucleotide-binding protein [Trichoderma harzianum]
MVHADASNFAEGITKDDAYEQVLLQAEGLFYGQRNWSLSAPSSEVNWAGFYVLDPTASEQLILGPFQGKVACQTIKFGKGVCGTAAATKTTQLVEDVEKFPGHIACDSESQSEIVVPIVVGDKVVAIIDVDCAVLNGFDETDKKNLEQLADLLSKSCDW